MKLAAPIALVLLAATAFAAAAAGRDTAGPTPARCGGELWRMKTLSDPGRNAVQLEAADTTIAAIGKRPYPRPVPKVAAHGLSAPCLAGPGADHQVPRRNGRDQIGTVRPRVVSPRRHSHARLSLDRVRARARTSPPLSTCSPTNAGTRYQDWQSLGAIVYVRGIGFWSQRRGLRGAARNGAELHPVTGLRIVAGC